MPDSLTFIIGRSGVGKSTLLNALTSPYENGVQKYGEISFRGFTPNPLYFNLDSPKRKDIKNYTAFMRGHLAYIPQQTGSFHPLIPLGRQLYTFYSFGQKRASKQKFIDLVEGLSKDAGFDRITVSKNLKELRLWEQKIYADVNNPERQYPIIQISGDKPVLFPGNLSQGQKQRLLILGALLRLETIDEPIFLADEIFVNLNFAESNNILDLIFEKIFCKQSQKKCAIIILHDLSYPVIRKLSKLEKYSSINKNVTILSGGDDVSNCPTQVSIKTISLERFFYGELSGPEHSSFLDFRRSFDITRLRPSGVPEMVTPSSSDTSRPVKSAFIKLRNKFAFIPHRTTSLFENLNFDLHLGSFTVISGFSGCGKTQFLTHLLKEYMPNSGISKKSFRYFPSTTQEALSYGSSTTVSQDLRIMFAYYNQFEDIESQEIQIVEHFRRIGLDPMQYGSYRKFLNKKIYTFSGGELQRYYFGRLTFNPCKEKIQLLVFDESISSLDCITKDELLEVILDEFFIDKRYTILFVSHDLRDIGVIFKEIKERNMINVFEFYEIFDKKIYKLDTNFSDFSIFIDNVCEKKPNCYWPLELDSQGHICYGTSLTLQLKKGDS